MAIPIHNHRTANSWKCKRPDQVTIIIITGKGAAVVGGMHAAEIVLADRELGRVVQVLAPNQTPGGTSLYQLEVFRFKEFRERVFNGTLYLPRPGAVFRKGTDHRRRSITNELRPSNFTGENRIKDEGKPTSRCDASEPNAS